MPPAPSSLFWMPKRAWWQNTERHCREPQPWYQNSASAEDAEEKSYRCHRDRALLLLNPGLVPMLMSKISGTRLTTRYPFKGRSHSLSIRRYNTIILPFAYSGTCTGFRSAC
jgi:hypothetical protein